MLAAARVAAKPGPRAQSIGSRDRSRRQLRHDGLAGEAGNRQVDVAQIDIGNSGFAESAAIDDQIPVLGRNGVDERQLSGSALVCAGSSADEQDGAKQVRSDAGSHESSFCKEESPPPMQVSAREWKCKIRGVL